MTTAERSLSLRRTTLSLSLALAVLCAPGLGFAQQATAIAGTSDDPAHAERGTGAITGRVTMLSGGNAASGVRLELEGTRFSTRTDAGDHFSFEGVPPVAYTLIATHERYGETRRSVAVTAGGATVADLVMVPRTSATELDKVVVHGMSGATTLRSVSSPISVITAEEIERKQALNLTDLLRGQFPGMTLSTSGQNDWSTLVNARGDTSWNNTWSETNGDYMKILIDDVEIVRPTLLSLIDPRSIERIEIVRGPLAVRCMARKAPAASCASPRRRAAPNRPRNSPRNWPPV